MSENADINKSQGLFDLSKWKFINPPWAGGGSFVTLRAAGPLAAVDTGSAGVSSWLKANSLNLSGTGQPLLATVAGGAATPLQRFTIVNNAPGSTVPQVMANLPYGNPLAGAGWRFFNGNDLANSDDAALIMNPTGKFTIVTEQNGTSTGTLVISFRPANDAAGLDLDPRVGNPLGALATFSLMTITGSSQPGCRATTAAGQTFAGGGAATMLGWDTNIYEQAIVPGSVHSTTVNPSRFTAPDAGIYIIGAHITCVNAPVEWSAFILLNAASVLASERRAPFSPTAASTIQVFTIAALAAGDYIEFGLTNSDAGVDTTMNLEGYTDAFFQKVW